MVENGTFEVLNLGKRESGQSGLGYGHNAMEYLKIGDDTLVFRFAHDASERLRTGRRPGLNFRSWYSVFGWKASEPYRSKEHKTTAIRVRAVRQTDHAHLEAAVRAATKAIASTSVVFFDWSRSS